MSTMFADTLLIVFISVCTALLAEGECAAGRWGLSRPGCGEAGRPWGRSWPGGTVRGRAQSGSRGAGRGLLLARVASPLSAGRERVNWGPWRGRAGVGGGAGRGGWETRVGCSGPPEACIGTAEDSSE